MRSAWLSYWISFSDVLRCCYTIYPMYHNAQYDDNYVGTTTLCRMVWVHHSVSSEVGASKIRFRHCHHHLV